MVASGRRLNFRQDSIQGGGSAVARESALRRRRGRVFATRWRRRTGATGGMARAGAYATGGGARDAEGISGDAVARLEHAKCTTNMSFPYTLPYDKRTFSAHPCP